MLRTKHLQRSCTQYLNCKILHGGDAFAALTKRIWHAKVP